MTSRLGPVAAETLAAVHPQAARSVFWELGRLVVADAALEKEAWLTTVLLTYGTCGFNLDSGAGLRGRAKATVLFCGPADAPGAARMPSGPVSADAHLVTSLFIDPDLGFGAARVLLDAALAELTARRARVVEAFGLRTGVECAGLELSGTGGSGGSGGVEPDGPDFSTDGPVVSTGPGVPTDPDVPIGSGLDTGPVPLSGLVADPQAVGLMPVDLLESAGFTVVAEHPVLPRLRLELPPAGGLLSVAEAERLLQPA